jgi:putative Mg2+ transporter-C (MgtC) family protein
LEALGFFGWSGVLARLCGAVAIGALIGINRELRGKPAGVKTHSLVSLSGALVTLAILASSIEPDGTAEHRADALSRVIQGILTGVGFVGAGVILRDTKGTHVFGLTTAATIWMAAVLGIACGAGLWAEALAGTLLTLVVLILGGPFEQFANSHFPRLKDAPPNGGSKPRDQA